MYQKRYFGIYAKVILLSIIPISCSTAIPILLGKMIDNLHNGFSDEVFKGIFICFAVIFIDRIFNFIAQYHFSISANVVANQERKILFDELANVKSNLSGSFNVEQMINRIAYEPYSLGNLYGIAPLMLSLNVITFIIGFCVLLYSCGGFNTRRFSATLCVGVVDLNWQLLIIISVFIPLVYIAGNSVKKNIMEYSKARSLVLEDFVLRLTEALKGFTDIKIFRVENKINKTLKELSNDMLKNEKAQLFYNRLYLDITGLLSAALPLLSLVAGFLLMQYGKTTLGVVISFYMYVGNYVEPVTNIADLHSMVIDANEKKETY